MKWEAVCDKCGKKTDAPNGAIPKGWAEITSHWMRVSSSMLLECDTCLTEREDKWREYFKRHEKYDRHTEDVNGSQ